MILCAHRLPLPFIRWKLLQIPKGTAKPNQVIIVCVWISQLGGKTRKLLVDLCFPTPLKKVKQKKSSTAGYFASPAHLGLINKKEDHQPL